MVVTDAGTYSCLVTSDQGQENSFPANLTVNSLTDVTLQPLDATKCEGDDAFFVISATGGNLVYQWQKNGVSISDDARITGSLTPILSIINLLASDSGSYSCSVVGDCAPESSDPAKLTVNKNTSITNQPISKDRCVGSSVTFSVIATGGNLTYQWKKDGANLINTTRISGATSKDITISGILLSDQGAYSCLVTGICGSENSLTANLTVNALTTLSLHPQSLVKCEGEDAVFTVEAVGSALVYEWRKNGTAMVNDGTHINGATTAFLVINNLVPSDGAAYQCFVTGTCGNYLSDVASLVVNPEVQIITNPTDATKCMGEQVSFSVTAIGTALTYQWKKNGTNLSNTGTYSGTTTNKLQISSTVLADAGVFTCLVTGTCGSLTTSPSILMVNENIVITSQPTGKSVCPGTNTSFSVAVTGSNPTYQWQKNSVNIPGATNPTLNLSSVTSTDNGFYKCIISGTCGTVISALVQLDVYTDVNLFVQPSNYLTCEGSTVNFNVAATGSNLTYRWQYNGSNMVDGTNITGATTSNLTITNLIPGNAGGYSCAITGTCGAVNSNTALLTVDANSIITTNPADIAGCPGDNIIFSTIASGSNLLYQWVKDGINLPGESNNNLVLTTAGSSDIGTYFCKITNACGSKSTNLAVFTLNTPTLITAQPADVTNCEGANGSFTVLASGSNISYQWTFNGIAISDTGKYSGANTNKLNISNMDVNYDGIYLCQVNGSCGNLNSEPAFLTVNKNILIITQPNNKTVCPGTNVSFSINATGSALTYQWQFLGSNIPGETNNNLILSSVASGEAGPYRCKISGTCGQTFTNTVVLSILDSITILSNPVSKQICEGNNADFSVSATGSGLIYQWKKNGIDLTEGSRLIGTQTSSLTIEMINAGDAAVYSCFITNSCGINNSLPASLTVYPLTKITTQPTVFQAVENGNASFSVTAIGNNLTYQWYKDGVALFDGGVYSGVTSSILNLTNLNSTHAGSYYCFVSGTCGSEASSPSPLLVNLLTLITTHPAGPIQKCSGESVGFNVVATGTNLSYQWKKDGVNLIDNTTISGSNSANLSLSNLTVMNNGSYSCLVNGNEGSENSFPASLTVSPLTDITLQPLDGIKCEGDDAIFAITANGDNLLYQWQKDGVNLSNNARITGSDNLILSITTLNPSDSGVYICIVTGICGTDNSNSAKLTVNKNTLITGQPVSQIRCEGTSVTFSISASGGNISFQWKKNGVNLVNGGNISGATSKELTISNVLVTNQGAYSCFVSGPCGSENSLTANLTVNTQTQLSLQPENKLSCAGENVFFTVLGTGTNVSYSWEKNGVPMTDSVDISGSNTEILTLSNVTSSDIGVYRCVITGTCASIISDPATLIVNEYPGIPGLITGATTLCQGETNKAYEVPQISNSSSYEWSLPYGVSITSGAGSRYIVVNYAIDALGGDFSVHGKNSCGPGDESVPLTAVVNSKPVADAGFDQNLCSNSSVMEANNSIYGTWNLLSGFGVIAAPGTYNSAITNLGKGNNVLVWTVTENNCTTRDTVILTNNIVSVNAGQDHVICGNTTTLDASTASSGIGSWSVIPPGGANFVTFNSPLSSVINIKRGTNIFQWSVNNNGCITSDQVSITNDLPTNSLAGSDTILLVDSYVLAGNIPSIGTGIWSLENGSASITDPLSPTSSVTNLGIGENLFKWTITNNSCYLEDQVKVMNYTPSFTNAGPDQTICNNQTSLVGTLPNYGSGQWTIVQGSGTFLSPSNFETEIIDIGQGNNIFRWTIFEYQITSDDVTIINNSPTIANAGLDQNLCVNQTNLAGNQPNIGTASWVLVGGSAIIADATQYNTGISNLSYGTNSFRWTITNGLCSLSDVVNIANNQPSVADAGITQTTCADSIILYPNTPSIGTGEWSVISGSANFVGNKAYNLAKNDNSLKWTISNKGCISTDTVIITSHKPTTAVKISDKSICTDSLFLSGNTPLYGTGTWSILNGSAVLTNPSDPKTLARNLAGGQNKFRWTINYQNCISYSDANVSYDLIQASVGEDQVLCSGSALISGSDPGVGTGLWTILGGSGLPTFLNSTFPDTEIKNLDLGTNLLRWTVTNKGCNSFDELNIENNNPTKAFAGTDRIICGESIFLSGNNPNIGNGTWIVINGSANFANPNLFNTEVTNLNLGQNTLRWTIVNGDCSTSDEITITNNQPSNIDAGPDQYLCADSAVLFASISAGGTGRWSIASGSATFSNSTLVNSKVKNLEKGTNQLLWTVTIAGCSNYDTVSITNNLPSLPSAGPDQDICASETFMAANLPQIGTGKWGVVSGASSFVDPFDAFTKVINAGNGANLVRWTITNGSCSLSDEMSILNSLPTLAYAGEDRAICNYTANLLANPPTTGTGIWKVASGFGVIDNPSDYNTQITNLGFGQNTLRWTTENGRCSSSDDVIITNNLSEVNAGLDEVIYIPVNTLVGNRPLNGIGEWKIIAGQGNFDDAGNFETRVTGLGQGANTFSWTINNDGCIASDEVIITYYLLPTIDFLPSPQEGCAPLTVDFINSSIGGYPFSWDFGDGTNSNETNPMHTFTDPGRFYVTLTGSGPDGILIKRDTVIFVRVQPDAQLNITPTTLYISDPPDEKDEPLHCFTLTKDIDSVTWNFGDDTFSNELNPLHRYQSEGVYDVSLNVVTGYQCSDYEIVLDAIKVLRKGHIDCPNAFTPNLNGGAGGNVTSNDDSNDVFHCYAEGLLEYTLEVYNKFGVLLFQSNDINIGWDGYFQGSLAQEGVYIYSVSGVFNSGEEFNEIGSMIIIYNK